MILQERRMKSSRILLINYLVLFVKPDCFDAAVIDLAKGARNGIEKFQEMKVEDGVDQ